MSHVLRVGVADQIAYFRAYNTDGSAKTDLTSSTTGLALSVFRIGASSVSIASLSNKAADNTAHADGAIRNVGGNLYTIDIPDAATATQVPSIVVRGTYTGGVVEGLEHPIVAYDPSLAYQQQLWAAANSTVNLSGTTIKTATDIETDTVDIQSRIPDALENGRMKASVSSGDTGARTITITVNDGTSPLEGAKVRVRQGSENYVQTTNASGVVTFNLDDFTWNVAITKTGYTFTATTLVVNGSTSPPTYSMTLVSLTPSDPDKVTGYWTVLGENGEPKEGVVVTVRAIKAKSGSVGLIHVKTARTETTDSEGIAEFANMLPGWSYSVSLDGETIATVAIASDATDEVELGSCILAE